MIYRRNTFAWSLLLAALIHAVAIGWVRLPQLESKRQRAQPLLVRLFSIAEEPAAQLKNFAHLPASVAAANSAAAEPSKRPEKSSIALPGAAAREQAAEPVANPVAGAAERQPPPVMNGDEALPRPARPEQSASNSAESVRASYEQVLAAWLDRAKYYPAAVRRRGLQGAGELRVRIDRDGRVLALTVSRALPHPVLDEVVQDWVHRADPFPAIPSSIIGENFEFLVPVSFRLD